MIDFDSIEQECSEEAVLDDWLPRYIAEKAEAIIHKKEDDYPLATETYEWPDAVWKPKNDDELKTLVCNLPMKLYHCSLNWIDTSDVKSMANLFRHSDFNGNISKWNTSNVIDMTDMFYDAQFMGDIFDWDYSHVQRCPRMFCHSSMIGLCMSIKSKMTSVIDKNDFFTWGAGWLF